MTTAAVPHEPVVRPERESSIAFRAVVYLNTAFAYLAFGTVDNTTAVALPLLLTAVGSAYSYVWRFRSNFWVKWVLAAGMLYALWAALDNLIRGVLDARLALAQLLLWLQVLNSFDLPQRKNLRVAMLVAGILLLVAATLSRTSDFGWMLAGFAATLVWALFESFRSEVQGPRVAPLSLARTCLALLLGGALVGTPLYALAPRQDVDISRTTLPLSLRLPLPDNLDSRVRAAGLLSAGGSAGKASGTAGVSGFSDELDLNVRSAPSESIVMRVKSPRPQYWRALSFDRYDGRGWKMADAKTVETVSSEQAPIKLTRPRGQAGGVSLVQTFYIERDQGNMIFSAWTPTLLFFPSSLVWRDVHDSLRSPFMLESEMYYSVVSETPIYHMSELATRKSLRIPDRLKPYLQVPPVSARTRAYAKELAGKETTPYRKMRAISDHLQTTLTYRLDVPAAPPGREWVDFFLFDQKAGFCEQFATSLAVLARLEGIPTRLVTGYLPGDYNPFTGFYEVKGKHAHAWVEAWMPMQGWVPFDATPDAMTSEWGSPDSPRMSGTLESFVRFINVTLGAAAGPVLALGALILLGVFAWWYKHRPADSPTHRATRTYRRLRARLARKGVPTEASDTPGEWLEAASGTPAVLDAMPELTAFVARYEAARFGGAPAEDLDQLARDVERAMAGKR